MARVDDRIVPGAQVDPYVDRGGETLVPVLTKQEVVRGREQSQRRQRTDEHSKGPGELQRLGAGSDALAAHVDKHHLQL